MTGQFAIAFRGLAVRLPRVVREHEILRVVSEIDEEDIELACERVRDEVLKWTRNKVGGFLPNPAWAHQTFEHLSGGRNCAAIRIETADVDIWGIRADDPDKEVPGRIWTTEVAVASKRSDSTAKFSLRLLASSQESELSIEPHTPGLVHQIVRNINSSIDSYRLDSHAWLVDTEVKAERLVEYLVDANRKLPVIVLSVSECSEDATSLEIDATSLARATIGLARVVILKAEFTWLLTERFGKRLSVFGGAIRLYQIGFTEDSDPYGPHKLILSEMLNSPERVREWTQWLRRTVAADSIRRTRLDEDVLSFATIRNTNLRLQQKILQRDDASIQLLLEAAHRQNEALEVELQSRIEWEQQLSDEHKAAEERSQIAESQLRSHAFRIQQLVDQLKERGEAPDANIKLPSHWKDFAEWCDTNLAGRVTLATSARRAIKDPQFDDPGIAAKCLLWLANEGRDWKLEGGGRSMGETVVLPGYLNSHCGSDVHEVRWQGRRYDVEWHIKSGGNTRDPVRCLRIYYFWDDASQQFVVSEMPAHRVTDAS